MIYASLRSVDAWHTRLTPLCYLLFALSGGLTLAACLAMVMFSLAGIPPLFGFWGKFVVFQAAVEADLIALAAVGIAASVIGAFYYIKIVKIMYFDEPANVITGKSDWAHQAILALCALFLSPLGYLLTIWLGGLAGKAAAALFIAA